MVDDQAVSSPADVFNGLTPTLDEYNSYRTTGEVPARFKPAEPAESAPADAPEETVESEPEEAEPAPESDPEEEHQEPPQKGSAAEKRIKQLLARIKELEGKPKQDVKPESSPEPDRQYTRTKPTVDAKDKDGNPKYSTYEDYVEDLADWKAEQRMEGLKREYAEREATKALQTKLEDARSRYDDADDVIFPTAQALRDAKIPQIVKQVFEQSEDFIDLCYVVGSDPDELEKFVKLANTNPRAAMGKVFEWERGIREELATPRKENGQFATKTPEPKKTAAPKPPSPVGGASQRGFDVNDDSLSADEWFRKRNEQLARKG